MDDLEYHPLANLFPLIEGEEFDALVGDIRANGLHDAIDLYQGKILDGRNRWRAAKAAGIELERRNFRTFMPELYGDPLGYVISKNLNRRHLDESQRAMVAARLATMRQGERTDLALKRQAGAHTAPLVQDVGNANRELEVVGFVKPGSRPANLPVIDQKNAAKALSISERALRHARRVQTHGAPELVRAVDRGRLAVSVAERATHLPPDIQRKIAAEAEAGNTNAARNVVKQEARGERERDLAQKQRALPQKKYGVILADPEWRFEVYSRDTGMDRAADNHYPTSETDDICKRDVASIAADDCVLFLWATVPMLPDALKVMEAWGFTYKSHRMWRKTRVGTGYWFRNAHELLLVGTRGNIPAPAMGTQWDSVGDGDNSEHSRKPDWQYELIEHYFPNLPKIELNARRARDGWDRWGNEAPESLPTPTATMIADTPAQTQCEPETMQEKPSPDIDLDLPDFLRRKNTEGTEQVGVS